MDSDWAAVYSQTSFYAETPSGHLRLRIGESNAELDDFLRAEGARTWMYITAYNPGSILLIEEENRRRQAELERTLRARGLRIFPGKGIGDDGEWPSEPSLLVLGVPRDVASEFGRRFGQRAVVWGERGGPPELLACSG